MALALDPAGRFAYILDAGTSTLEAFAADPATGALSPIGSPVSTARYSNVVVVSP